ncbi:MAG: hypothetical protein AB7S97_05770 [Thermoplasmata archaeon]
MSLSTPFAASLRLTSMSYLRDLPSRGPDLLAPPPKNCSKMLPPNPSKLPNMSLMSP